jgi:hypothetical protein
METKSAGMKQHIIHVKNKIEPTKKNLQMLSRLHFYT